MTVHLEEDDRGILGEGAQTPLAASEGVLCLPALGGVTEEEPDAVRVSLFVEQVGPLDFAGEPGAVLPANANVVEFLRRGVLIAFARSRAGGQVPLAELKPLSPACRSASSKPRRMRAMRFMYVTRAVPTSASIIAGMK
ncbi:hypothetical protein EDM76_12305 [bacterium]|nr:MAG: hypothetical protein EDM76_12305 [bacterium]